jgi:hypothetical protein
MATPQSAPRSSLPNRAAFVPWLVSFAVSGVFILVVELTKSHYAAHKLGARIGAAIAIWLVLGLLVRLIVFIVDRLRGD